MTNTCNCSVSNAPITSVLFQNSTEPDSDDGFYTRPVNCIYISCIFQMLRCKARQDTCGRFRLLFRPLMRYAQGSTRPVSARERSNTHITSLKSKGVWKATGEIADGS